MTKKQLISMLRNTRIKRPSITILPAEIIKDIRLYGFGQSLENMHVRIMDLWLNSYINESNMPRKVTKTIQRPRITLIPKEVIDDIKVFGYSQSLKAMKQRIDYLWREIVEKKLNNSTELSSIAGRIYAKKTNTEAKEGS